MRIAVPMRRRVLMGGLFAGALIALLPLRLATGLLPLEAAGIGARAVTGPVWAGRMAGLTWRGLAIGDVDARVQPLPLLLGRVRLALAGDGIAGAVIAAPGSAGVEEVSGTLVIGDMLAGLPVASLSASDLSVRFAQGRCLRAEGRVSAQVSALPGVRIAQPLTGTARCDGAALLLPLAGPSGLERLDLRFTGDGRWRVRLALSGTSGPAGPAAVPGATAAGLELERSGRF